jgi:hypothetical protein
MAKAATMVARCSPDLTKVSNARSFPRCARRRRAALLRTMLCCREMLTCIDRIDEALQWVSVEVASRLGPFSPLLARRGQSCVSLGFS